MLLICLTGCASQPVRLFDVHDVDLATILIRWQDAVADANSRTDVQWHHGWIGNAAVADDPRHHFGKCIDWQELAYLAVRDVAGQAGYQMRMIRVNRGSLEHDAVIVFRLPAGASDALLYDRTFQKNVTVLDGWKRGGADAWPLDQWLAGQQPLLKGLEVFDGDHEMTLREAQHMDLRSRGFQLARRSDP